MQIEVINWRNYNERKDYHCHWFKFQDDIFISPTFPELNGEEFKVFMFILCVTCQKQGEMWEFDVRRVSTLTRCSEENILSSCQKLEQFHIVRIRSESGPNPYETVDTLHNITVDNKREQKKRTAGKEKSVFDFESLYQKYPLKKGKEEGLAVCVRTIRSKEEYEKLARAVTNYAAECVKEGTEKKYIKYFSTFMNSNRWRDYVDTEKSGAVHAVIVDENC